MKKFRLYISCMNQDIYTDRLSLRPLRITDASFIHALFNSETWLQFIGDRGIRSLSDAENFLENNALRFFREKGWGTYLIALRSDGTSIGTVGLYEREQLEHPDFGYALLPEYAGKGYATEASTAYIEEISKSLAIKQLLAIVQADNERSHRVLIKLGFEPDGTVLMEKELQKWVKYFYA
jgi:RimJ/RimL family protein N-acetyltransferase